MRASRNKPQTIDDLAPLDAGLSEHAAHLNEAELLALASVYNRWTAQLQHRAYTIIRSKSAVPLPLDCIDSVCRGN